MKNAMRESNNDCRRERSVKGILYNTVKLSQPLKAKPGIAYELGHSTSTSCGWVCSKLAIL